MASQSAVCNSCRLFAKDINKEGLDRCAGCKQVFYCSQQHQKDDWNKHKTLCKQIQTLNEQKLGFVKTVVSAGQANNAPKVGQQVMVHYIGSFPNGNVFDQSKKNSSSKPFTFTLGKGQVIKGWDEGIQGMNKGEKATLVIAPEFAYGDAGYPPRIPPRTPLIFDVELIDFS